MSLTGPEGIIKGKLQYTLREIKQAIENKEIIPVVPTSVRGDKLKFNLSNNIIGVLYKDDLVDLDHNREENIEFKVGNTINVVPVEIEYGSDNIIVRCSRALAQRICHEEYIDKLVPGDIIDAKVINMTRCGVFCDIGCGNVALMTMNDIAVSYVNDARDVFKVGQYIKVVIKNKSDNRIMISMKELLGTWNDVIKEFNKGDIVVGKVILINEYGAFIRLRYNLVGLIDKYPDDLSINDFVTVRIDNIHEKNNRIKLSRIGKADPVKEKIQYFYNSSHLDNWQYTEEGSKKNHIEYSEV